MRRSQRLIATAVLISLCGVLAGCGGGGLSNWDPSDMLDFLDTKKKLPGKREPVFPEGVPGIEQGVPKDLYKSNVEQQQQEQAAAAAAALPSGESGQARRSPDGTARSVPAGAAAGAAADGATAAAPPRKPKRLVHRRATSLPKEEPAPPQQAAPQQPQPVQQSQPAASPFPAPLPSGSFSH
ncbi:hypothetical protein V4R08_05560 [Nitrobacter sp. NHB1]|uniref:hypothetical protein n=1 Tax=Nitrobacter sp. NHB1 TaxID=3119830 RepID=UPI002FFF3993